MKLFIILLGPTFFLLGCHNHGVSKADQQIALTDDMCTHIQTTYRVNTCKVRIQDSLVHVDLKLAKDDAMSYRWVTLLEQCILVSAYEMLPKHHAVLFETRPDSQDTAFVRLFHRSMRYSHALVQDAKRDSELNPRFYQAKQYILAEIQPQYIYAIDQCYQHQVLEDYTTYSPTGPTFIFLVQARTMECRDTPASTQHLDELERLYQTVRAVFDSNPGIAEKLTYFLEPC